MSGTLPPQLLAHGGADEGKVCLVTGGGSGIGRATALRMAEEGAEAVVIAGRRESRNRSHRRGVPAIWARRRSPSEPTSTREDEVERLVQTAVDRFGRLDVAFNNAGFQERRAPLEQQSTGDLRRRVRRKCPLGVPAACAINCPAMFAHGRGRIVVNASVSGVRNPNPGFSLYSASKAAVISLARSAAMEAAPRGISDQRDRARAASSPT